MGRRIVSIWFRHLLADYTVLQQPELKEKAFVLVSPERGRMVIHAVSSAAADAGIETGMVLADARAVFPRLEVLDEEPGRKEKLLEELAIWCIRFTPVVATDPPDGLLLDVTGCTHLWKGERAYLKDLGIRLKEKGYLIRAAIADTAGAAWAVCRYGKLTPIITEGQQLNAMLSLPPAALRLDTGILDKMYKLGFYQIGSFIHMPRSVLRRRFGQQLLERVDQSSGSAIEVLNPVEPPLLYRQWLPCLDPIRTAIGIEIAIKTLLDQLCKRLKEDGAGLRTAILKCHRVDGALLQTGIGTNRASRNAEHLFKLFELKVNTIEPALGIELFLLEAPIVEEITIEQEALWQSTGSQDRNEITELLDRLAGRCGTESIHRYLPDEHHWPERSVRLAASLEDQPSIPWRTDLLRPIHLLSRPEPVEVTVRIPDYPPMLFRYQGVVHYVKKADGPERIEQEWWIEQGEHRDYYSVEDQQGRRYWLFRLGHYGQQEPKWFLHGFFA